MKESNELQIGAAAFVSVFGSLLNEHVQFHVCVVDDVFLMALYFDFWRTDLWENATAREWGVDPTHPDAADQDQSLHW
jgi:hypothetical protein